jgi:Bifunctional DNA primase/polymerase, N-terminal
VEPAGRTRHCIVLPPSPTVQTASGGFHRYFLVPKWFRVPSSICLWPGIDILAAGSNVILPGSRTVAGPYRVLRSFDARPIPDAPRAFIKLIRQAQRTKRAPVPKCSQRLPDGDNSVVSSRQWWLLFRNTVFRSFWSRTAKIADTSDSAYEYHLAKACFCCGLNQQQTVSVILKWRKTPGFERSLQKLRGGIVPAA